MEESEVVAAIVAGDPAGLAEALDTYVAPLLAYCRSILSQAEAAEVVEDTFAVARTKLDGLLDPSKLGQWLEAVARNECCRRIIRAGGTLPAGPVTPVPDVVVPNLLPGRIMKICTDDTPTGRAHRAAVTHRAGQFGHDGFPKPVTVAKRRRRVPVAAAVAAVVGAGGLATVLIITMSGGGSHSGQLVFGLSSPTGIVGVSSPVDGTGTGTSPGASPGRSAKAKVTLEATRSSAPSPVSPTPGATGNPGPMPTKAAPSHAVPPPTTTAPTTAAPQPSESTATYSPPPKPILLVTPTAISLVSVNDAAVSASISIEGYGSTVTWSAGVSTGGGHIAVGPTAGTLSPGASTTITVTVSGTASFTAHILLMPGDHMVTVKVTAKKVVTKALPVAQERVELAPRGR